MNAEDQELYDFILSEYQHLFEGWDFSYIESRVVTEPLTWSYHSLALNYIRKYDWVLDMETGGGEFLSQLQPLPPHVFATEGYVFNIPVAQERLQPLGVKVVEIDDKELLPFNSEMFNLILNKHGDFDAAEVKRVLKQGGMFLTQQVGHQDCLLLNEMLDAPLPEDHSTWNVLEAVKQIEGVGMQVLDYKEHFPRTRFFDIGALAYYLKVISWQIPDFSVDKYFEKLKTIHYLILQMGFVDVYSHRFMILAQRR